MVTSAPVRPRVRVVIAMAPTLSRGRFLVEAGEQGGQALGQHRAADAAEELGHEPAADAGEAGVLVAEAGAVAGGLEVVGDLGLGAAAGVGPGVAEQVRLMGG